MMDATTLLQIGSTATVNASLCALVGCVLARWWLLRAGARPQDGLLVHLRAWERSAAVLGLVGQGLAMWAAAAVMMGHTLPEAAAMLPTMLAKTSYGRAGVVAFVFLACASFMAWRSALTVFQCAAALGLLGLFALARASVSHGGEGGILTLGMAIEWLHLVLIALWVGGVAIAGWCVLPAAQMSAPTSAVLHRYLESLSLAATAALGGIVLTGVVNAWARLGLPMHLVDTGYGLTLIVKLVCVGAAAALGGYNKLIGFPALIRHDSASAKVIAILRLESVLLAGALVAAAVLTSQQPPAAM
ncbi:MAG TPA: CopD family protein [Ideonella sp.]|uniref:copper resistance D family protein n=1 Tax=Ideonella sp. TaxID=1929293 RepID=UPI002BAEECC6|nr:CopD family protein [Ideonella sp.]HSI47950.1 CopD family protein [Ideonella sp.]